MNRPHTKNDFSVEEITEQLVQHVQSRNLPDFYKLVKNCIPTTSHLHIKSSLKQKPIGFCSCLNLMLWRISPRP